MNASRNADETTPDETESSPSDDGAGTPTTGDKIVLGASIAGATLGACLAGPLGAIVGWIVGGTLAVAGVEKFDESDVENKVKNAVHELRYWPNAESRRLVILFIHSLNQSIIHSFDNSFV